MGNPVVEGRDISVAADLVDVVYTDSLDLLLGFRIAFQVRALEVDVTVSCNVSGSYSGATEGLHTV